MTTRRELLSAGAAAAAIIAVGRLGGLSQALAQQKLTEADVLQFSRLGNVTLLHMADLHAQLLPVYLREPSVNIGFAEAHGFPPHITGHDLLRRYGIPPNSPNAYALTAEDFVALAKEYGRMGGLDRLATVIKAVRAERGTDRVLLLDSGDTFQGSFTSLRTLGQDVADCIKLLKPDAMTGNWEFTYGEDRFNELTAGLAYPFLAFNVHDMERERSVLPAYKIFEKGGVKIAVLGHAYPHAGAVHPRSVLPPWNFGIREDEIRATIEKARREGTSLVVLLSHDGFDVDRQLASRVDGIDIILSGHGHDALPEPVIVGKTLIVASGSYGKFLTRLDLDVRAEGLRRFRHKLIPIFADVITPDAEVTEAIKQVRAPFAAELSRVLGRTESLLYRRGTWQATFDDLIGAAIRAERDAEFAFSPGYYWGPTVLAGSDITVEDIYNVTAMPYPEVYRVTLSGAQIKQLLEDAAEALCNPDPYQRLDRDMLRASGLAFTLDLRKQPGSRISALRYLTTGKALEAGKNYDVAGWGNVSERIAGPPVWEVVEKYLAREKTVRTKPQTEVKLAGT